MAQDNSGPVWDGDNGRPFREPVSHGEKDWSDRGMEGAQASDGALVHRQAILVSR